MISWQGGHEFDHLALSPDSSLLPHVSLLRGCDKLTDGQLTQQVFITPSSGSWRFKVRVSEDSVLCAFNAEE